MAPLVVAVVALHHVVIDDLLHHLHLVDTSPLVSSGKRPCRSLRNREIESTIRRNSYLTLILPDQLSSIVSAMTVQHARQSPCLSRLIVLHIYCWVGRGGGGGGGGGGYQGLLSPVQSL